MTNKDMILLKGVIETCQDYLELHLDGYLTSDKDQDLNYFFKELDFRLSKIGNSKTLVEMLKLDISSK